MSPDSRAGAGDTTRRVETACSTMVNEPLKSQRVADQLIDKAREKSGSVKDMAAADVGSSLDHLKQFASKRPYATAATLVFVIGITFLNTFLRKKRG